MQTRSARPSGRKRVAGLVAAVALGLGTALIGASPALAAAPTLDTNPTPPVGWDWVTLTGKADAGADVVLLEQAYYFYKQFGPNLQPAEVYFPQDIVAAKADASGNFTLRRRLDSGFAFQVQAGGVRSNIIEVPIVPKPSIEVSASAGNVTVRVLSEPNQEWLPVVMQRRDGDNWTAVASGNTDGSGVYATVLTNQPAGVREYRAAVGPEPDNLVSLGYSVTVGLDTGGSGTPTTTQPTTTPPTTPPTSKPTTTPPTTPPTSKPTTTPPTTTKPPTPTPTVTTKPPTPTPPVVIGPKVGDVKFTYAYYNSPGSDTGSNTSLNREYVRITNKTKKTINLKYWKIRDRAGNTYTFTSNFYLYAGKSVTLRTGKGKNTSTTRYWGRGYKQYVWNNTGDTAYVRSSTNKTIDTCSWGKGKGYTSC